MSTFGEDVVVILTGAGASMVADKTPAAAIAAVFDRIRRDPGAFPRVTLGPGTTFYARPETIGLAAEGVMLLARGFGHSAAIRVLAPWKLRHACGATHDPAEWFAREAARVELALSLALGRVGHIEVRACDCGEEISLANMALVNLHRSAT